MRNEQKRIVIWGTGVWGNLAYYYYQNKCEIVCYVDSDNRKWGEFLNGIEICNPDVLDEINAEIVVALKYGIRDIEARLGQSWGIKQYTWFKIDEESKRQEFYQEEEGSGLRDDVIVIHFSGGLGNQMFQYALYKNLECQNKRVVADLSFYNKLKAARFNLTEVFKNITLTSCTDDQVKELILRQASDLGDRERFEIYHEIDIYTAKRKRADLSLLDMESGIIYGLHQNYKFPELVRKELLKDFKFESEKENKLSEVAKMIRENNMVGIHIRRGDYLQENYARVLGNVCSEEYFLNAIHYIKTHIQKCKLCFFSDDIDWVKKIYVGTDYMYIEKAMFDEYEDWYDMYLMSICKHNIISNSTFSWWGAWLNQNQEKIVIAPETWISNCVCEDICPIEWMRI